MLSMPVRPACSSQTRTCSSSTITTAASSSAATSSQAELTSLVQRQRSSPPSTMSVSVLSRPVQQSSSRRPKLSLDTAHLPSPFAHKFSSTRSTLTDSPTTRNTHHNVLRPLAIPSSNAAAATAYTEASTPQPQDSASATASPSSSPLSVPYTIPIGSHGILRNSRLPSRLVSATSARTPKLLFPPLKRVKFSTKEAEVMPTPVLSESESDTDPEAQSDQKRRGRKKMTGNIAAEEEPDETKCNDGNETPSTPMGWKKPPRQWVWTIGVDREILDENEGKYLGKAWDE